MYSCSMYRNMRHETGDNCMLSLSFLFLLVGLTRIGEPFCACGKVRLHEKVANSLATEDENEQPNFYIFGQSAESGGVPCVGRMKVYLILNSYRIPLSLIQFFNDDDQFVLLSLVIKR